MSDLISRADAIKELQKRVEMIGYDDNDEMIYGIDADRAMSAIEDLPSADRQKGEWKWTHGGQCSECGFHNSNFDFNFCPHCGADMRGGDPE